MGTPIDFWKIAGSIALGVVIGLLGRFFFERFKADEYNAKGLASVIACLLGGTAIGYLTNWLKDGAALALYPVGLLGGILLYKMVWPKEKPPEHDVKEKGDIKPPIISKEPAQTSSSADPPTFTILEVKKTLRFLDVDGKRAHFQRIMKMRANARATEFWVCTVSAEGKTENIKLDGSYGARPQIEPNAGQVDINARFQTAIRQGDEVELRLDYDLVDSFSSKTEYLGHQVQHQTQKVTMAIEFFDSRPCIYAWCALKYAGDTTKLDSKVERAESGLRISIEITQMKIGEEYRLSWNW